VAQVCRKAGLAQEPKRKAAYSFEHSLFSYGVRWADGDSADGVIETLYGVLRLQEGDGPGFVVDEAGTHFVDVDEYGVDHAERGGTGDVDDVGASAVLRSSPAIELVDILQFFRTELVENDAGPGD